jgi:predicted phosphodiesterase
MKNFTVFFFFAFLFTGAFAQVNIPKYTVYLIGDAGKDTAPSPAIKLVAAEIKKTPNSAVIFLGDNVYPRGVGIDSSSGLSKAQTKMQAELSIFKTFQGKVFMVPGNHDWDKCSWNGKKRVMEEALFVNEYMRKNTRVENRNTGVFYPEKAGPGPASMLLSPGIRLVLIDTQWWLQQQFFHPVGKDPGKSKGETELHCYKRLDSLLAYAMAHHEKVIIASHHPLFSKGKHALKKEPWRFLVNYTPFQIFGLLGLNRVYMQDTEQPRYRRMKRNLLKVIDAYPNIIYACGHDHNMQFSKHDNLYHIVSGSGSMHSKLHKGRDLLFSCKNQLGFFKLSYFENGRILVEAIGEYNNESMYQYEIPAP